MNLTADARDAYESILSTLRLYGGAPEIVAALVETAAGNSADAYLRAVADARDSIARIPRREIAFETPDGPRLVRTMRALPAGSDGLRWVGMLDTGERAICYDREPRIVRVYPAGGGLADYPVLEVPRRAWRIVACYAGRQIPTFELDADTHGCLSSDHARRIARSILVTVAGLREGEPTGADLTIDVVEV